VEGNNRFNDWWAWEQASRVKQPSGLACDHYNRYAQDFDLAVELGHNAHRFSIEWSRIEPARGRFDDGALAHYRDVVRALRERRLEPVVTLHHYTTPRWAAEAGSWANAQIVDWFGRYTERVVKVLGDSVRYWVTINEPMVFVNMHYVEGVGPPGAHDFKQALRVIEHVIRAHAVAYRILHGARPQGGLPMVSVAKHLPVFVPCRVWMPMDRWASWMTDRIFNGAFLEALTEGRWSVPGVATWTIPEARGTLDYLGVNYYGRQFIRWNPLKGGWLGGSCDLGHHPRQVPERTSMGWDVSPEAFTHTLLRGARLGLPMLVTENGTWMHDDVQRWRFLARHLAAMKEAMDRGANVMGYLCWSLLDNFEWAHGYSPRFGLAEVDYQTQERRIRDSGRRFAEVCRTNQLKLDEAAK
jgi:beta-glucosidase